MSGRIPLVTIVGRPNVGKSTLFNKLIRKRRAITLDTPGITRDPIVEEVVWEGRPLRLVDTGGLEGEADISLAQQVHDHTVRAIGGADLVVVLLDAREGLNPVDRDTVDLIQRMNLPAIWVANKADGPAQESAIVEFCRLGIDAPLGVSAEHGIGLGELRGAILAALARANGDPAQIEPEQAAGGDAGDVETDGEADAGPLAERAGPCRVAIVGRPNVGKSSFLNRAAKTELSLVDDKPGTTRDVVDTLVEHAGNRYLLLDTAGMRRPSKVDAGIERISVRRSMEAVRRADVVVLMIEPVESLTDQDARLARIAWKEGRALVVIVNKIDLLAADAKRDELVAEIYRRCPTLAPARIELMSVLNEVGIGRCLRAVARARRAHNLRIRTSDLNRLIEAIVERRQPPVIAKARLKLFYVTQTAVRPPTLTFFTNREHVPEDYVRFMERCIREQLPLEGTPLRLRFRRRDSHDRG